jgi:TPR repeat protein
MRRTFGVLLGLAAATMATSTAQTPRKKACDFLTPADVEAATGLTGLTSRDPWKKGEVCDFLQREPIFNVNVYYTDAPDPDLIAKFLKRIETTTFDKVRPIPDLGDAAYYQEPLGKTLTVFVGGELILTLGPGTAEQLATLARKALGGSGRTTFAYHNSSAVPATTKPVPAARIVSASPLEELKATLTKKADAGDAGAENALAGLYRYGKGGPTSASKADFQGATYWYKRASDHGMVSASYQLAIMYHEGIGVPVNDTAARELFTKAADAGYVPAMVPLAFMYAEQPDMVSKRRAAEWAMKASQGNDQEGQLVTGYLWDKGLLSFDDRESGRNALAEYRKAADQGNCIAMMNIGGLYFNGSHGMKQDAAQAQAWFDRAQACFGKAYQDLQQKAVRFRSLAAAGHLPVPQAPPPAISGSRFFKPRAGSGARGDDQLAQIVGDMLELTALSAAYAVAHPEVLAQMKSSQVDAGVHAMDNFEFQQQLHYNDTMMKIATGNCRPPIGC